MKSVELQSRAGGKAEVDVQGLRPKLNGLFSCFGEILGVSADVLQTYADIKSRS